MTVVSGQGVDGQIGSVVRGGLDALPQAIVLRTGGLQWAFAPSRQCMIIHLLQLVPSGFGRLVHVS